MFQIAIIGAGQLGSRHLQGLARVLCACEITVVDPSPASLAVAQQRFEEMPANGAIRAVRYATAIELLPVALDYVIVATAADVRLPVLKSLLAHCTVRFLLLEKVLFQGLDEYPEAEALLKAHGVPTWVNCPRRIFPLYQEVRAFFGGEPLQSLDVNGGNWGLGCNSIHFLDVFGMLTAELPTVLTGADLDKNLIPSKRKNFMEFTGSLRGRFGAARFALTSGADSAAKILVTIRSETRTCVIDEGGGLAFFWDGTRWEQRSFKLPFLSELATSVATDILTVGTCGLPTYDISQAYHLPLLTVLGSHAAAAQGSPANHCPIT